MPFLLVVLLAIATIGNTNSPATTPEIRGRVTTSSGQALSNVTILGQYLETVKSDQNGEFVWSKPTEFVRFSKPGYRPVTKKAEELRQKPEVTMTQDEHALWVPSKCAPAGQRVMTGTSMQFMLPPGVHLRSGQDIDYQTAAVCLRKSCLQIGWGPLWSFGFPPPREYLEGSTDVQERDIQYRPEVGLQGIEYRGTRDNGTFMRWIGIFGETIGYDNAPKEAAQLFDTIIDSLCWKATR